VASHTRRCEIPPLSSLWPHVQKQQSTTARVCATPHRSLFLWLSLSGLAPEDEVVGPSSPHGHSHFLQLPRAYCSTPCDRLKFSYAFSCGCSQGIEFIFAIMTRTRTLFLHWARGWVRIVTRRASSLKLDMHLNPIFTLGEGLGTNSHPARFVFEIGYAPEPDCYIGRRAGYE